MNPQHQALLDLSTIDARLKKIDDEIALSQAKTAEIKKTIEGLEASLSANRAKLATLEQADKDAGLDIRSMNQQMEQSRDKMGRSRTERETNAVSREMEELRKLLRDRDIEVQKLHAEAQAIHEASAKHEEALAKAKGALSEFEGSSTGRVDGLVAERQTVQAERETVIKTIPPALFRKYESIRQKRGTGVAETTNGTCKACNIGLPPQMFHRLMREPVVEQCPNCNRLIFFVPVKAAVPASGEPSP